MSMNYMQELCTKINGCIKIKVSGWGYWHIRKRRNWWC